MLLMKHLLQYIFLFATLTTLMASCADNDSFTQSATYRLAFSTDTVRLDTTFSNVPRPRAPFGCSIAREPTSVVPVCGSNRETRRGSA